MELAALNLLIDIAIIMVAALVFGGIAHKILGQPPILGYLFAGIAIGPGIGIMRALITGNMEGSRFGLITDIEEIGALANLGVSLLLFAVGLEFSSKRVGKIIRVSAISGTVEMVFMLILGLVVGLLMGWEFQEAALLGATLMISSTIIIIKMLDESGQTESLHGRLLVGRLVVEDIGAIVVITLIAGLLGEEAFGAESLTPVLIGIIFLSLILIIGRRTFPMVLDKVSKARSKELFLLTIFGICIGTAVVSEYFGLSLALGAFLAGMMLSEYEHNLDIVNQIRPLKDIFLIIFFVSAGMAINLSFLLTDPMPLIMSIVIVISVLMFGKAFANTITTWIMGYHPKTSLHVGMSMMQIGEFSFIIATLGFTAGIIRDEFYSVILLTALISMVFTPYAMSLAPKIYNRFLLPRTREDDGYADDGFELPTHIHREPDILILGFAEVVQDTVKCLQMTGKKFLVIDFNPKKAHAMMEQGIEHIYGDASNEEVLLLAGVSQVELVIVTLSDMMDAETAIQLVHKYNKDAYIVARAYNDRDRDLLVDFADDIIISEEVAGRRLAWHVLQDLGFEEEAIRKDIEIVDPDSIGGDY
ncbi:MAG: cation:proton antiporter [Thermoplasmata archaeon]|nr:cation:proton antiporter [Thermoplasmata archaeon]